MSISADQFVALMAQHQRELFRYITALVPHSADADDIFQETSVALWADRDRFELGTDFGAWARTVARYRVLDYRKRVSSERQIFSEEVLARLSQRREAIDEELGDRRMALDLCMRRLTEEQRRLLELRYGSNRSVRQAAEDSGRSINTLYSSLNRVRQRLLDCINQKLATDQ